MSDSVIIMGAAGRMGTMIASLAAGEGLEIAALVDRREMLPRLDRHTCLVTDDPVKAFAANPNSAIIDFTAPDVSLANARIASETKTPLVIGTTGLDGPQKAELEALAEKAPILWSPNMSIGVNVLCEILPKLAALLGDGYDMEMVEVHHNKKKDSPSGTALRLAETMAQGRGWNLDDVACCERNGIIGERPHRELGIQAVRGGDVAGIHTAYFLGQGERIEVTHHAHSRENFALGALRAARWMIGRAPGRLYTMADVLKD